MKRTILVVLALLIVGLVALAIFQPFALAIIYGSIFGYGIPRNAPAIAGDAQFSFLHGKPREAKWTAILQRNFPAGSSVGSLLATLQAQGFEVDPKHNAARYEWGGMPCTYHLGVGWTTAANQKVGLVWGDYDTDCL